MAKLDHAELTKAIIEIGGNIRSQLAERFPGEEIGHSRYVLAVSVDTRFIDGQNVVLMSDIERPEHLHELLEHLAKSALTDENVHTLMSDGSLVRGNPGDIKESLVTVSGDG